MKNNLIKVASVAVTTILSYSTINLTSAQAANHFSEFFLTAKTTQSTVKIEPTAVINDVIKPNSKAIASSIGVAQLINIWLEKTNLEYKFLNAKSQTKFVTAQVGNWQYNLHKKTSQPLIDPGIVLGIGLISVSRLFAKKRL